MTSLLVIIAAIAIWLGSWGLNEYLVRLKPAECRRPPARSTSPVPAIFGICLLALWELLARGLRIPEILLPAPSVILVAALGSLPILWADFRQTVFKEVLPGYAIGCGAGFVAALIIDRSPFLKSRPPAARQSRFGAADRRPRADHDHVVRLRMALEGRRHRHDDLLSDADQHDRGALAASGHMERDLMRTYAASWWQTLVKLRLPAAWPFIFNALKINSTLAHDRRDRCRILRLAHRSAWASASRPKWAA